MSSFGVALKYLCIGDNLKQSRPPGPAIHGKEVPISLQLATFIRKFLYQDLAVSKLGCLRSSHGRFSVEQRESNVPGLKVSANHRCAITPFLVATVLDQPEQYDYADGVKRMKDGKEED
ncbi:hypothetical protein B0H13DRAFT_1862942 [Mycena leptocephala]|nr:hypothetical protein B0H13DRAFT_1862942 [Mycena leptocephala]